MTPSVHVCLFRLNQSLRAWCCATLALTLAACATTEPSPEALVEAQLDPARQLELGDAALRAGRAGEALEHYQAILQDDPDDPEARLGLGEAYLANGNNEQALATFAAIVDRRDIDRLSEIWARARQGQGIAQLRLGRLADAHATLSEAATWDPTRWRTWNALGQIFDGLGKWSEARASYQQAMWAAPEPARIHNNLGMSFLQSGDGARAIDHFDKALQLDPDLAVAQANLRLALAFEGNYVEALAGASDKELPDILNNVGYVALLRGDYPRAEAYFSRALEVSPSFYEPAWQNLQYLGDLRDKPGDAREQR